jgi:hypothetical protein
VFQPALQLGSGPGLLFRGLGSRRGGSVLGKVEVGRGYGSGMPITSSYVTSRARNSAHAGRTVGPVREGGKRAFHKCRTRTDPKETLLNGKILHKWRLAGGNGYPGIRGHLEVPGFRRRRSVEYAWNYLLFRSPGML